MSEIYTTRSGHRAVVLTKHAPGFDPWIGYWEYHHPAPDEGLITPHPMSWHGLGDRDFGHKMDWDLVSEGYTPADQVGEVEA